MPNPVAVPSGSHRRSFLLTLVILLGLFLILFGKGCRPDFVLFSNDAPYGGIEADHNSVPETLTGYWQDLNWIGSQNPSALPTLWTALRLVTTPLLFSKIYVPATLFILGICAFFFFRQLKLTPPACTLGTLAIVLNSGPFSIAAWGVAAQCIMMGMMFVALGLIVRNHSNRTWLNAALAGMAVGMGVMEGFDMGALFSLLVAAFVMFHTLTREGPFAKKIGIGVLRVAVVAVCAGFLATNALSSLISTQIKGVGGMQQDEATRAARWDEATQWSLPKREALGLFIPGLFGYRMDTPRHMAMFADAYEGGVYWGAVGRHPIWDRYFAGDSQGPPPSPNIPLRFSGGNGYAGVLVVLVAVLGLLQSFRGENSIFTRPERKFVWFWGAVMVISLLLAFGRFAPFYGILYQLPYFSTIRNPAKFASMWDFATVILFTVGVNAIIRRYIAVPGSGSSSFSAWWRKAAAFDRRWVFGTLLFFVVSVIGWIMYSMSKEPLARYMVTVGMPSDLVVQMAKFSVREVGWYVFFLAVSSGLVALILSGKFAGPRARMGGVLLGIVLVFDLARAALPWIIYWDYPKKYATNPIIEILRKEPFKQRVASMPDWIPQAIQLPPEYQQMHTHFDQLYSLEWAQHHFQYYNIQSLDLVQMPRMPQDLMVYRAVLSPGPDAMHLPVREWELTNTRYLLGTTAFIDLLNQGLDSEKQRFRIVQTFEIALKPGVLNPQTYEDYTAVTVTNGRWALMEFTGALPRAKLYGTWHVSTNDAAMLQQWSSDVQQRLPKEYADAVASRHLVDLATLYEMTRPEFNPHETLLLAPPANPEVPVASTNANTGTVEFKSYEPKRIVLQANATAPSILLLNDRYEPNWKVTVDGQPSELLRANFIMRGVYLAPGEHTVEFRFEPPVWPMYVSVIAIIVALGLTGIAVGQAWRDRARGTA